MNKYYYEKQLKSTGTAYLFFFLFGAHFAYLGKWGLQILFWVTFYGLGVWGLIELFRVGSRVEDHNQPIYNKLEEMDKTEKQENFNNQMAMMKAAKG